MSQKPTPDEVLARWDACSSDDRIRFTPHWLANALREAIRQRDEARADYHALSRDFERLDDKCAKTDKERDEARAALEYYLYALRGYADGNCDGGQEARAVLKALQKAEGK